MKYVHYRESHAKVDRASCGELLIVSLCPRIIKSVVFPLGRCRSTASVDPHLLLFLLPV